MSNSGSRSISRIMEGREVRIPPLGLRGMLHIPEGATSLVIFAHGSGSSRHSPRNLEVAVGLNRCGMATLLFDLLTGPSEETESGRAKVFNIPLLAGRLMGAIHWASKEPSLKSAAFGLFGASTGAAAALVAAAQCSKRIAAVVSRGGRPDLAGDALESVRCPTLLIVGGADYGVIELNEVAFQRLGGPKALEIVPGATHLFEERGALQDVIALAADWFERYLQPPAVAGTRRGGTRAL